MASSLDFTAYICEQIFAVGRVAHKKMFGEYMVYANEKPIFLICADTLFVKIVEETTGILGENCEQGFPYKGAKLHYVVADIDDRETMLKLARALERITPLPKPRKKKRENI